MTKKKLIAVLSVFALVLFCSTSYLNFLAAKEYAQTYCQAMRQASIANVRDELLSFAQREEKDFEELSESLRNAGVLFNSNQSENRFYAYAVADREGNVVFESESGIWFWNDRDTEFLSLEKYMTSEIKKEILDFKKKSEGDFWVASNLCVNLTDGVYVPVSLEITDNRLEPDNNESITVKFTDREVTHTFNEYLTCEFYNLEEAPEYDEVKEKLEKELQTFDYSCNARRSLIDTVGEEIQIIETVGDYHFIGFVKYNLTRAALTSGFFREKMVITAFVFVVLTVAALGVAVAIFNKGASAEKKAKESASADADEIKKSDGD